MPLSVKVFVLQDNHKDKLETTKFLLAVVKHTNYKSFGLTPRFYLSSETLSTFLDLTEVMK